MNVPFIHIRVLPISRSWLINCWLLNKSLFKPPLGWIFMLFLVSGVSTQPPWKK